jgi:DeoR/GlpR family transcriptional regulator of sugar metabolism
VVLGIGDIGPLIDPYDTIVLGPGSSVYYVCKQLEASALSCVVCTNSIALVEVSGALSLFILSGAFQRGIWSTTGEETVKDFLNWQEEQPIDAAILGTSGIRDYENSIRISVHNTSEKGILGEFIECSPKVIFVTGDPKIGKTDTTYLVDLDKIADEKKIMIVTSDIEVTPKRREELNALKENFEARNIKLIIASEE